MAEATPETDKLEVPVGQTVKGGELVIVPTQTGLYRIECRGQGAPPKITDQIFTSLVLARRAVENYRRANAGLIAKEALKRRIASSPSIKEQRKEERRLAAMELKNGALESSEDDNDED
jgi:hypothetical protein